MILYSIGKQTDDEKHEQEVATEKSDESEEGHEPIEQRKVKANDDGRNSSQERRRDQIPEFTKQELQTAIDAPTKEKPLTPMESKLKTSKDVMTRQTK